MNDERFEHDLKSVLRDIAGGEAPMSLRNRVADLIDRAPVSRRLWFSPPLKLSLAAVAAVAVVVMAFLVVRPLVVGPTNSQTPEPSASASASSVEPSPSAQPTATLEPTATPAPPVAAWTGLDWAPARFARDGWWVINDVVSWGTGYVGVGSSRQRDATAEPGTWNTSAAAFFTSADGQHWTIAQEGEPISSDYQSPEDLLPAHLVVVGDRLLAIGPTPFGTGAPMLWGSEDGSTWTVLENASWKGALTGNTLLSLAAGPTGVVVVGAEGNMCCANPQGPPLIIHSADGVTWDRLDLSAAFDKAYFRDVAAYAGGFAIVGRVGAAEVRGSEPPLGVPAAWTSLDGVTWSRVEVEGSQATGAFLTTVIAGADGLFATGRQTDTTQLSGQGPLSGWASTDGRSWHLLGAFGTDLLPGIGNPAQVAGDGRHMVLFGRESCKTTELSAWSSLDGVTWTRLAFSGTTQYLILVPGPICNDDGTEGASVGTPAVAYVVLLREGVFLGTSSSAPTSPGYWFLRAVTK